MWTAEWSGRGWSWCCSSYERYEHYAERNTLWRTWHMCSFGYWSLWSSNTQRQGNDRFNRERSQRARSYPSIFIIEFRQQGTILFFFLSSDLCIRVFLGGQNIINEQSTRWFMSSVADSLCLSSSTHTMSCAPTDFHRMREYNKICVKFSAQHCFCLSSAHNIRIIRGGKKLNTFTQAALKAQC